MSRRKLRSAPVENIINLCKDDELKEWLEAKETVTAMSSAGGQYFGMGFKRALVVMQLGMKTVGGVLKDKARRPFRKFATVECEGNITSMCWIKIGKNKTDQMLLAVGTDSGFLLIISCKGALLHRQNLNTTQPIVSLHPRQNLTQVEDLLVLVHPTTLVTVNGSGLSKLVVHNHSDPTLNQGSEGRMKSSFIYSASPQLSDGLTCNVHKLKPPFGMGSDKKHIIRDVVPVGKLSGSVLDVYGKDKYFHVATVGSSPSLAGYTSTLDEPVTAGNLAKKITKTAVNMVMSSIGSRLWGAPAEEPVEQSEPKMPKAVKIEPNHVFNDSERVVNAAVPNSTGRYLAVTDSLGRISVVDSTQFIIIKMLKGYREASVVWLDHQSDLSYGIQKTFIVYLPRRGIIEAWRTHSPQRVAAMKVGFHCRLLDCIVQCCVLQSDGTISSITLEATETEELLDDVPGSQSASNNEVVKWKALFSKAVDEDGGLPSKHEYCTMLESIQNSVDLLECVISVPDTVPIEVHKQITDSALSALEKRGSGLEEVLLQNGDSDYKVRTSFEAMEAFSRLDNLQLEKTRLLCEDSPDLDDGRVFRYLINRTSVLSAYATLITIIDSCSKADNSPAVVENAVELRTAWENATKEQNAEMLHSISTTTTLLPEKLPLSVFLSYFDMLGRATSITAIDKKLAEFICFPMTQDFESFGKCSHMLSLPGAAIIKLLILWGERGGDVLFSLPFDRVGRLAVGSLMEFVTGGPDDGIPKWLGDLSNFNSLQLVSTLIISSLSRTEKETEPHEAFSNWLRNCMGLFELRMLLLKQKSEWITHLSITSLQQLPPGAIIAAAFIGSDVSTEEEIMKYITARDGIRTVNAHTAMFLVFSYLKRTWGSAISNKTSVCDCWLGIANSLNECENEIETSIQILTEKDVDFRSIQWCAAATLCPIQNVMSIAKSRRVAFSSACRDVGKSSAFIQEHILQSLIFLDLLLHEVRTPGTTPETSSLQPPTRWWGNFSFDKTLVKLADSDISFPYLREIKSLLQFISASLDSDIRILSPFDEAATIHWGFLFPAAALKMQLVADSSTESRKGSELTDEMMKKREELLSNSISSIQTVENLFTIVEKLRDVLQISKETSSLYVLNRLYLEGQDKTALDYLTADDAVEVPNIPHCIIMIKVIKLRLQNVLSQPMAGGTTQQKSERSLNLMSGLPLDLVDWIASHQATEDEESIVIQWVHSVPCVTVCQRLKNLTQKVLKNEALSRQTAAKLQKVLDFVVSLLKNL